MRLALSCVAAGLAWLGQCGVVYAQPTLHTVWHCWYDADHTYSIKCFLPDREALSLTNADYAPHGEALAALDELIRADKLLTATRLVRTAPQQFPGKLMYIPLYNHPYRGMDLVERLANAAMCGRRPACTVAFDPAVGVVRRPGGPAR